MTLVFAKIAEQRPGLPVVYVRPHLVAAIRSAKPIEGTEIHFSGGGMILVDGDPDDVQAILELAMENA